ncbi:hypothetical protein LTR93_011548 [Exophiala xenobiotica]|nr:hypothetical protein LTR93_011548 [Exophiala xenobiotica]
MSGNTTVPCKTWKFVKFAEDVNKTTTQIAVRVITQFSQQQLVMAANCKFSPAVRDAVELALDTTAKQKDISLAHGVSESYISKTKGKKRDKELGLDQYYPKNGRLPILDDAAVADLLEFLEDWPTARLDECCGFLHEGHEINASTSTISRVLKQHKITHKRVTRINARRDEDLLTEVQGEMAEYTAEQIVVVDESAANERTTDRKFG